LPIWWQSDEPALGKIERGKGWPMNSTPNPTATDPNDDLVARADERLAHAYEQIARADEQVARVTQQLSKLERDAARKRSAVPDRRSSHNRPALRGLAGLLLAACIFLAAFVWRSPYGDAAKLTITRWAPQLILALSLPLEKPGFPAPTPSPVQVATPEAPPAQATAPAQSAPQDVRPTAAAVSPELAQLQTMARNLASVEQGIEQLKARQEQIAGDNARAVEQLKASQEQMTRDQAKAAEQFRASQGQMVRSNAKASALNPQRKPSAPPPRQIAAPSR
jgi:hypothetical protein